MTKKTEVVVAKTADSADLPDAFGMVLDLPADVLVARAADGINAAARLDIGSGLCLLKAKSLCKHGEFDGLLKAVNIPAERARELMAVAEVLQKASPDERKKLMQQPKTSLIGLARMDDAVRQKLLDTGVLDERLTLNEYRSLLTKQDQKLAKQDEDIKRLSAQVRSAELSGRKALDAATPLTVTQVRKEAAGYAQDALACVHGFTGMANRLSQLKGDPATRDWVRPVALSMVSLLQAVQESVANQLQDMVETFGLDVKIPAGAALLMNTPGPEEVEQIRDCMRGVLIDFETRHAQLEHGQYLETRMRNPSKGAPRKAPGAKG